MSTRTNHPYPGEGLFGFVRRIGRNAARRHAERTAIAQLASMDDHLLRDIGVRRGDVQRLIRCGHAG